MPKVPITHHEIVLKSTPKAKTLTLTGNELCLRGHCIIRKTEKYSLNQQSPHPHTRAHPRTHPYARTLNGGSSYWSRNMRSCVIQICRSLCVYP